MKESAVYRPPERGLPITPCRPPSFLEAESLIVTIQQGMPFQSRIAAKERNKKEFSKRVPIIFPVFYFNRSISRREIPPSAGIVPACFVVNPGR
jgi:hypothetical protein